MLRSVARIAAVPASAKVAGFRSAGGTMFDTCVDGIRIYLDLDGTVFVNEEAVAVSDLLHHIQALKPKRSTVCYSRANPHGEPPPNADSVIQVIIQLQLPVAFFMDNSFEAPIKIK